MAKRSFRALVSFGRRIEYWIVGRMLKEGLDVYFPLVDDDAVDALVRRPDGSAALLQIKARSRGVILGDAALFAAIDHPTERDDYWFVLYSKRMEVLWIMTSRELIKGSHQNKKRKNAGKRTVWCNGRRRDKVTGERVEYTKPQFETYVATSFRRIRDEI